MNFSVRDGKFDVVIASGPRVEIWPSAGVRALSSLCAEMGLTVGQFGGESIFVRGVIPLPGTGGIVLVEDIQKRIHRIHARSVIRIVPESFFPDPFPGWRSPGLIPISTAERLRKESQLTWGPSIAILGTGNRALRLGSALLETGTPEVFCIEAFAQWGAKRFAGWEVERRRFEMLGGKMIEATPLQLIQKGPLLWQFRLQDSYGIRVLEVGRVISAGPFRNLQGVRSHPQGSFLFELDQTAANTLQEDVEGWVIEEERGKWLAGKIIKSLVHDLGPKRDELDRIYRRARGRIKRYFTHREAPFTPSYQGKWMSSSDTKRVRAFSGVPQKLHQIRPIASIECFEEIPCHVCQDVCPTSAIQIGKVPRKAPILSEADCNSCGICVSACPSSIIPMLYEPENRSVCLITLPWRGSKTWKVGEFGILLNRRGDHLGSGRITKVIDTPSDPVQIIEVEVPTHLAWEARSLKRTRPPEVVDEMYLNAIQKFSVAHEKVEITLNGEKRLVRDKIPISLALFEIGRNRPEDALLCPDGSCGLCLISVDGVKKPGCQTKLHRGMVIKTSETPETSPDDQSLCPCLGISREEVIERLKHGKLQSPEAVLSVTPVGEGKCHGQICMGALKRVLIDQGLAADQWIDWRFPWSDWVLSHS